MVPGDTDYNTQILSWNGMAEFKLDQNMLATETTVLD